MRMDYFSDLVEQSIDDSKVEITGDGSKFEARVISDSFDGVSTIKRHKMVYAGRTYQIWCDSRSDHQGIYPRRMG